MKKKFVKRSFGTLNWAGLACLALVQVQPALASNGTGRGGDDTVVKLEALLPKKISFRATMNYGTKNLPRSRWSVVEREWRNKAEHPLCVPLVAPDKSPDKVEVEQVLELSPKSHKDFLYRVSSTRARYELDGRWNKLKAESMTENESEYGERAIALAFGGFKIRDRHDHSLKTEYPAPFPLFLDGTDPDYLTTCAVTVKIDVWIDGKPVSDGTLAKQLRDAAEVLARQADFSDTESVQNLIHDFDRLERLRLELALAGRLNQDLETHSSSLREEPGQTMQQQQQQQTPQGLDPQGDPEFTWPEVETFGTHTKRAFNDTLRLALIERIEASAAEFLELGKGAVNAKGKCNKVKFGDLMVRLRAWSVGSPAYFYPISQRYPSGRKNRHAGPFDSDTQLKAMGIRQVLRQELAQSVFKYCDRQTGGRAKIDELLND